MKFIRIDMKGHWKGIEHKSSFAGSALIDNEENIKWENGISCYSLEGKIEAIENLYKYWTDTASLYNINDYKDLQITIFEGDHTGNYGFDGEDLAVCTNTIKEINAYEFMKILFDAKEQLENFEEYEEDGITREEYNNILMSLV